MKNCRHHIATSGWSYKHWKEVFYPPPLKSTEWLSFYAKTFSCTEINMSFYHLPKKTTVQKWMKDTPDNFKFCVKMSRYLTHIKRLHDPAEPLSRFFHIFSPMQKKMGPVLIQLPASLQFDEKLVSNFYNALEEYSAFDFALEARHSSWLEPASLQLMKRNNIAFVIAQSGKGFPYAEHTTSKNIYLRFHGPAALYASDYSENDLIYFAGLIKKWEEEKHIAWVFFNNDYFGYAIKNALQLEELVQELNAEKK